jgi:hypothetical protein
MATRVKSIGQGQAAKSGRAAISYFTRDYLRLERALTVNGALSVDGTLTLSRNAIVEPPFSVTVSAGPADWATIAGVAHFRQRDISGTTQSRTSVVIDFGVLRTVGGVGLIDDSTLQVLQVRPWAGTGFAPRAIVNGAKALDDNTVIDSSLGDLESSLGTEVTFPSEIKTERLQVDLVGQGSDGVVGATLLVQLPDLPADLDIRINGGAPVWSSPGAVAADSPGWAAKPGELPQQSVELSSAISALVGDPAADKSQTIDLHIVLAARNPGALELKLPDSNTQKIRYRVKVPLSPDTLTFDSEGPATVPLKLPAYASSLERINLTAVGNPAPERSIPPIGPDAALLGDGSKTPLAEVLLDATRAACVELPHDNRLVELIALRFPFSVEQGGAEIQIALMAAAADGTPGSVIATALTKPATLDGSAGESWTTFSLQRPFKLDRSALFAMITVRRGRIHWALTASTILGGRVFTGPPSGPWQPLPSLGEIASLRGRVRIVAHANNATPVPSLSFRVLGTNAAGSDLTPTPKGASLDLADSTAGLPATPDSNHVISLQVVSLVAGSVTLRDVVATVAS